MSPRRTARSRGFTLIEVLVALMVVALGMGALMATLTSAADATGYLRDKSLASWIALNRITQVRLARTFPATGKASGELEYAGSRWRWQQEIVPLAGMEGVVRIDVQVTRVTPGANEKRPPASWLATATGVRGNSVAAYSPGNPAWDDSDPTKAAEGTQGTSSGSGTGTSTGAGTGTGTDPGTGATSP